MHRLRLKDVQSSRIPPASGLNSTDAKLIQWVNEAQQRLLTKGLWWGSVGKFNIAAYDGCITLPPELAAIETAALSRTPINVKDYWFEFLTFGFGTRSAQLAGQSTTNFYGFGSIGTGIPELDARGNFPVFRDIAQNGNPHKLVLACDLLVDVSGTSGITATVTGWDVNNNWVRTSVAGSYQDGEVLALAQSPGTTSVNTFSRIEAIQFTGMRSGQVWLYDFDTVAMTNTMIGRYQWHETSPSYQRYFLPSVGVASATLTPPNAWQQDWRRQDLPNPPTGFTPALVEVMAKLEYRPVSLPTDYLIIQSIPALKKEILAVELEEDAVTDDDFNKVARLESGAISELDAQLDHYLGSGRRIGMNVVDMCEDGNIVEVFE